MAEERRATFRVSVKASSGLVVTLHVGDKEWGAKAGNISAEGIFVRLESGADAVLEVGSEVDVELTLDDKVLHLHGVVRSQRAGGYGIHFPELDERGNKNPLDETARISMRLQRELLAARALLKSIRSSEGE